MYRFENERGAVLILVFVILVGLSGVAFAFLTMVSDEIGSAGAGLRNIQAFYIAEAGRAKARWALTVGGYTVPWTESDTGLGNGTFTVDAPDDNDDGSVTTITSSGYIPDDTNPIAQRQVVETVISIGSGELTNLSLDATISASSEKTPSNHANDGDGGTIWKADAKGDAWLKLDFGSSATFDRVVVNGQKNIDSVAIKYSDIDSDDDDDHTSVTNLIESPAGTFTFDSVEARYLRFNMDVDSKKTAEVNELESYDTSEASGSLGQGEFSTSW